MAEPSVIAERIELALDTAGPIASVALTQRGVLLAELTWQAPHRHAAELLPAVDALLARAGREREQIGVVFVNRGPGGYAGLRVGISTAMGLALGLGADLLSAGRLELDAYAHAAWRGPICALHQAGRGDLAWAVYEQSDRGWVERLAPRLRTLDELLTQAPKTALFCGELAGLEERLGAAFPDARLAQPAALIRRAATLGELCWSRYAAGARDNPLALEPLYLREPSITKAKPRTGQPTADARQARAAGGEPSN